MGNKWYARTDGTDDFIVEAGSGKDSIKFTLLYGSGDWSTDFALRYYGAEENNLLLFRDGSRTIKILLRANGRVTYEGPARDTAKKLLDSPTRGGAVFGKFQGSKTDRRFIGET